MAAQQLSAKREILAEQLAVASAHLESLITKKKVVNDHSKQLCNLVNTKFNSLKHALDRKEKELVSMVLGDTSRVKEDLDLAIKSAELIIEKSARALKSVECNTSSRHLLGECLMELLLLPREDFCYCDLYLQTKIDVDVSHLQSLIEQLKLNLKNYEEDQQSDDVRVQQQACPCSVDESTNVTDRFGKTLSNEFSDDDPSCLFSHGGHIEAREKSVVSTMSHGNCNVSMFGEKNVEVQVPYLQYSEGMHLTAYVTNISTPSSFIAQPYGSQLVKLMHDLSDFYENDGDLSLKFLTPPKVGDICCAQFTEDNYWYRAEVTAIKGSTSDGTLLLTVEYVDYGNSESLSLDRIRALENQFSTFPRQAMLCMLAGIEIMPPYLKVDDCSSDKELCPQILHWLHTLIAEKPVDLIIYRWLEGNRAEVDVCVPLEVIRSAESLDNLPKCIPVENLFAYTSDSNCSSFSLLSMMQSFRLAATPISTEQNTGNNLITREFSDCISESLSPPDDVVSIVSAQSGHDVSSRGQCTSPIKNIQSPTTSTLPSLLINLGFSGEFSVVVCFVVNPLSFYVHPVIDRNTEQLSCGCTSVPDNFIEDCMQSSQFSGCSVGKLCCVQSAQNGKWYRGIITNVDEMQRKRNVEVLHFDHGDSHWYVADQLKVLPANCCTYPAQAIHCTLSDIDTPTGNEEWRKETMDLFKQLTKSRNLIAFVKSKDIKIPCVFKSSFNTTLMVELVNSKKDVNINEEIKKCEEKGDDLLDINNFPNSVQISERCDGSRILQWNPMEVDFLAPKNNYAYDEEDASIAIQGYKCSRRVCRFYETPEGCRRGAECPFLHLGEGVTDQHYEETFTRESPTRNLPSVGDWIVVIVTALISATEFFIQLPLGCVHPLHLVKDDEDSSSKSLQEPELSELVKEMRAYYNNNVFVDRETLQPHKGEMIAAFCGPEECWYRGLVLDTTEDKIKVCYVDYGNVEWISERDIRSIREEYMSLPFQAVGCRLADVYINNTFKSQPREAKRALENLVVGKVLIAHVAQVRGDMLYVHLFTGDGGDGVHINQALSQKGIVSRMKNTCPLRVNDTLQPG